MWKYFLRYYIYVKFITTIISRAGEAAPEEYALSPYFQFIWFVEGLREYTHAHTCNCLSMRMELPEIDALLGRTRRKAIGWLIVAAVCIDALDVYMMYIFGKMFLWYSILRKREQSHDVRFCSSQTHATIYSYSIIRHQFFRCSRPWQMWLW